MVKYIHVQAIKILNSSHQWFYKLKTCFLDLKESVSDWLLFNATCAIFQLDFNTASSLKQQFAGTHVAPLGHIILIQSQPVFALSP